MLLNLAGTYLIGTADELRAILLADNAAAMAVENANKARRKGSVADFEAAMLYRVARSLPPQAEILEIGTLYGMTAMVLARAAPKAHVTTLTPRADEAAEARKFLADYDNVTVLELYSDELRLRGDATRWFDMVWIDGNHKEQAVSGDVRWWYHINPGGWMILHDANCWQSPGVLVALADFLPKIGRGPDLLVIDTDRAGRGLIGWRMR